MAQGLLMIILSILIYKYIREKIFTETDPVVCLLGMVIFGSLQFTLLFWALCKYIKI